MRLRRPPARLPAAANQVQLGVTNAFKPSRHEEWTRERVEQLSKQDIEQLRANADRLSETGVVAVCDEALNARPRSADSRGSAPRRASAVWGAKAEQGPA